MPTRASIGFGFCVSAHGHSVPTRATGHSVHTRASIGFGFCVSAQDIQCPLGLALGLVSVLVHRTFSAH